MGLAGLFHFYAQLVSERKLKVVFAFREKRTERLARHVAGQGPDEFLYGANHLDPAQFSVDFIEGDFTTWNWRRMMWQSFETLIARGVGIGFTLHTILDYLPRLRNADVIISTVDSLGLPLAALKWHHKLSPRLLYISQGLSDRVQQMPVLLQSATCRLYGRWLTACDRIFVFGEGARQPLYELFSLSSQRVSVLPFGVDANFWTPSAATDPITSTNKSPDYIFSIGRDAGRDYDTLLAATSGMRVKIVTRLSLNKALLHADVEVGSEFTDVELRALYRNARVVVIPLKDIAQPSGQSATLQAMSCGKAVILSHTRGLWDTKTMRHMENCYLVEHSNVLALREAIEFLTSRPQVLQRLGKAARRTIEEHCTSWHMGVRLTQYIQAVSSGVSS